MYRAVFSLIVVLIANTHLASPQPTTTAVTPVLVLPSNIFFNLTQFWQFDGNVKDAITKISLFSQYHASSYAIDRFGRAKSALFFNNGYIRLPIGVYISGDFTTCLWLYVTKTIPSKYQSIFLIQSSPLKDYYSLSIFSLKTLAFSLGRINEWNDKLSFDQPLLKQWTHVGITLVGSALSTSINGNIINMTNTRTSLMKDMVSSSYFGAPDRLLNAYLDDVMFFNRGLEYSEMQTVMNFQDSSTTSTQTTSQKYVFLLK